MDVSLSPIQVKFLDHDLSICKLRPDVLVPDWALTSPFFALVRTTDEISIVCETHRALELNTTEIEQDWIAIMVVGPLDFSQVGILSSLSGELATDGISVFAISTYNTDYLLVKRVDGNKARKALSRTAIVRD